MSVETHSESRIGAGYTDDADYRISDGGNGRAITGVLPTNRCRPAGALDGGGVHVLHKCRPAGALRMAV